MENINSPIEREWLLSMKFGDESSYEKIYRNYSTRIFASILRLVKDKEVAQDILQDVFLKAWLHRENIDPDKPYHSFLFAIAKNAVLNYIRRESLETQVSIYLISQGSEFYSHVEEAAMYNETSEAIKRAIDCLPPKRKEVYIRCKINGESYQQVAEELGCSVAAVNAHIVKATKVIKEQLNLTTATILIAVSVAFYNSL